MIAVSSAFVTVISLKQFTQSTPDAKAACACEVRDVLRLHHYSIHTGRSYLDWIKRYVAFHHLRCREDLADGERKIEAFRISRRGGLVVARELEHRASPPFPELRVAGGE